MAPSSTLLITGAAGFIGARVVDHFLRDPAPFEYIVATDIRPFAPEISESAHIETAHLDIRDETAVAELFDRTRPRTVLHLAAMVTPPPGDQRQLQYEVDVLGTRHITDACLQTGVDHFIYTSSGAAYGYHPINERPLTEDDPLRGNESFAYSHHKRLVEEDLARLRRNHPELRQLIFRVSTVLGPTTDNQITALFQRRIVPGLRGRETPFCIIADDDVVAAILHGISTDQSGLFNLTGDGVLTLSDIASRMGNTYLPLPERLLRAGLALSERAGLGPYGPEQILFLKYRPVLQNERLKQEFGFQPSMTTAQAFERYRQHHRDRTLNSR